MDGMEIPPPQRQHVVPMDEDELEFWYDVGRYQGLLGCACFLLITLSILLSFTNC
jgi:hypothetical protein